MIAILASVTVTAYSGVQKRADNTVTINRANQWIKILNLYNGASGIMNITGAEASQGLNLCLGAPSEFPAISGMAAGECWNGSSARSRQWFSDYITAEGYQLPGVLPTLMTYSGSKVRGMILSPSNPIVLRYFLKGTASCGIVGATALSYDSGLVPDITGTTRCDVELNFKYNITP